MHTSRWVRLGGLVALTTALSFQGCTKRPSPDELTRLDEARTAAESAERKLSELRSERVQLEKVLEEKQAELKKHEEERDDLKAKMGK